MNRANQVTLVPKKIIVSVVVIVSFMVLVLLYSVKLLLDTMAHSQRSIFKPLRSVANRFTDLYEKIAASFDTIGSSPVNRSYLIELAFRNMQAKKTRTIVTIGGMAIGIAFIVFLVSVGYGLQHMVTSRVARLEELQQAEVLPGLSDELALTDKTIANFNAIPQIKATLPLISVVGRISFQDSVSDLAVYGVTSEYLESSAIKPVQGRIFESSEIAYSVRGSAQERETNLEGQSARNSDGSPGQPVLPDDGQAQTNGVVGNDEPEVLGVTTLAQTSPTAQADESALNVSQTNPAFSGGTLPVVNLATSSATLDTTNEQRKVVAIPKDALREAVVNRAVLAILGMNEQQAVGQKITLTFVAVGNLIEGEVERIESAPTEYTIVGVTPEEGTPVVYVPFIELKSLGITRISQIKIIVNDKSQLETVRASIEAMGYGTVSVVDTVSQINNLFSTFRLVLGVIGMVALSVATLGMFNTLTVSLLERTREVGLMKAMGMKSGEVRELFLTESMIMGFYGGLLGLLIGLGAGKLLSVILSSIAIARGLGFLDISVVPVSFVFAVMLLSLVVGILTGYYPAKRATKISALNALRYE